MEQFKNSYIPVSIIWRIGSLILHRQNNSWRSSGNHSLNCFCVWVGRSRSSAAALGWPVPPWWRLDSKFQISLIDFGFYGDNIPVHSIRGPLERYLIVRAVLVRHSSERKGGSATTTSNDELSSFGISSGVW